jgi:protein-L-isoaspartate(D-aspartate) O-methyltransferase
MPGATRVGAACIAALLGFAWTLAAPASGQAEVLLRGTAGAPPPAFDEAGRAGERRAMVREQIRRRGVEADAVLAAMRAVPRHRFVPPKYRDRAYADGPLPIGHGQTISQPFIVARMTELLALDPDASVLEVGTGSGYQAAVAAQIAASVVSIEIVRPLAEQAAGRLRALGYRNVTVLHGDGYHGWPEAAPFEAIVVTAAAPEIPRPLIEQLARGGRMVIPVGEPGATQRLMLVRRDAGGTVHTRELAPVRFVPMTGDH